MSNPQKENGYTAIANEIVEKLVASGLNGTELAIILFILRKTYGYQKKQDEISLTQFERAIPCSRRHIIKALKVLQLVNILTLVKKGTSVNSSNLWQFNKNYDEWQLVKKGKLVNKTTRTSEQNDKQLVNKRIHTKENIQKKYTKENIIKDDDDAFNIFWNSYPRKVGKRVAQAKFKKISKSEIPTLMAELEKHKQTEQWKKDGGQFIPHPSTWLNQERWKDEIDIKQYQERVL